MATKELSELRHKYKMAYTAYLTCVQALSEASHHGVWPTPDVLKQEETALNELKFTRQALLDGLYAHTHKKSA